MIIFKRELKTNLKALIIWSLSLCAIILLLLSIYPQMAAEHQDLAKLYEAFPEGMRNAFGMDTVDISTVLGFYSLEAYIMITLFGSIYASILASGMLSKEESDHTAEFLLSRPVTRKQIVTEKLLVVFLNLVIFNVLIAVTSLIGFQFTKDSNVPMDTYIWLAFGAFLLHLTFAGISFMFSSFITKSRRILSLSLALVLIAYFLSIAAGLSDKLKFLSYLTPFEYVKVAEIMQNNYVDPLYIGLMLVIMFVTVFAAYSIYHKKDMAV